MNLVVYTVLVLTLQHKQVASFEVLAGCGKAMPAPLHGMTSIFWEDAGYRCVVRDFRPPLRDGAYLVQVVNPGGPSKATRFTVRDGKAR